MTVASCHSALGWQKLQLSALLSNQPWNQGQGVVRVDRVRQARKKVKSNKRSMVASAGEQTTIGCRGALTTAPGSPGQRAQPAAPARVSLYGQMTRRGFSRAGAAPSALRPLSCRRRRRHQSTVRWVPLDPGPTALEDSCRRPGHNPTWDTGIATRQLP